MGPGSEEARRIRFDSWVQGRNTRLAQNSIPKQAPEITPPARLSGGGLGGEGTRARGGGAGGLRGGGCVD